MTSELWYVGKFQGSVTNGNVWEFQGVFDTESKAVAACRDAWYFVCPVTLNEEVADETVVNTRAYYPPTTVTQEAKP